MSNLKSRPQRQAQLDPGTALLITGAGANVTIWIGAFISAEAAGPIGAWVHQVLLPILGGASGLAMGLTATGGLVYVLGRLSHIKPTLEIRIRGKKKGAAPRYKTVPNPRYWTAWAAIALFLTISPILLAPYVLMIITGREGIYSVLGDTWAGAWSIVRVLAADLALAAVAMVHGVQIHPVGSRSHARIPGRSAAPSEPIRRTGVLRAAESETDPALAPDMRICSEPDCGMSYRWPNGKGAHYKKHHPEIVTRRAIPVQLSQVDHES